MRKLKKVIIEGFGLYRDRQTIDLESLPDDAIVGIFGSNTDGEGGYDSNASGKTTFTNAISWGLFGMLPIQGESTRALSKEQVVNRESRKGIVGLEYQINTDLIYFESSITDKGTKKVSLLINGEEFEANTVTQKRDKFYSLLGISGGDKSNFIDFLNRCYFSGDITKSFASKNFDDKARLNIVAKIKKLDVYDLAILKCEKLSKTYKQRMNELEFKLQDKLNTFNNFTTLEQSESRLKTLKEKLENLEKEKLLIQTELEKLNLILKIRRDLDTLKDELIPVRRNIDNQKNLIKRSCERINNFSQEYKDVFASISKYPDNGKNGEEKVELSNNLDLTKKEINELRSFKIEKLNRKNEINKDIENLKNNKYLICPNCQASLIHEHEELQLVDKEKIQKLIKEKTDSAYWILDDLSKILKDIETKENFIRELEKKKEKLIEHNSIITSLKKRIEEIEKKYNEEVEKSKDFIIEDGDNIIPNPDWMEYSNYIEFQELDGKIKQKESELTNYGDLKYDIKDLNDINEKINSEKLKISSVENEIRLYKSFEDEIIKINLELDKEKLNFEKYDFWKIGFKQLKNIELIELEPELENTVNRILNEIGTGIVVQFNVKVEEGELSINLIEDSGNELPLELFSTGQTNRISFASGLALSELATESNIEYGFSMWDEVLDGLDNTGQDMFFEVLRKLPGLKFVISHDKKLQGFFENKMIVTRKNHSSSIKLET